MRPTSDTTVQRPDLGQAVWEVMTEAPTMGFVGMQIMPFFPVAKNAAEYPVIPKESLFSLLDTARGPLGHYNRSDGEFESGFYRTAENGLERRVDDRYLALYSSLFDYEMTISKILMNDILRAQEYRIQQKIFNTGNFSAHNATIAWSTLASANPKSDVNTGKAAMRTLGVVPNCLIIPYAVFQTLQSVADIKTQVYQLFPDAAKTGQVTIEHLKTYFDVPKVMVAGALYNSANQGQNATLAEMWGSRYAMLCRVAEPGADVIEPCIGRTFKWNEGASEEVVVEEYYSDEVRSNILRVRHDTTEAFLASYDEDGNVKSEISKACGYLIDTTAAT